MTEWTPKLEKLIRNVGDYVETQLKDLVDPKATTAATALRMFFRAAATGAPLLKQTYKEADLPQHGSTRSMRVDNRLQALVEIAEKNGSDAASKIKRGIAVVEQMKKSASTAGKATLPDVLRRIRQAKQQNIKF